MKLILFLIIAYFIGSIPTGVWLGKKFKNIDIREHGSRNSGATNSYRVLGAKLGISVLIGDVLKGFLPVFIASKFIESNNLLAIIGLVSILAHTFSIFIKFKGGKGVATSLGVYLFLAPKVVLILFIVFVVVVSISKFISLGSVICATLLPILMIVLNLSNLKDNLNLIIVSFIVGIFVLYRHRSNIARLISGYENKFKF